MPVYKGPADRISVGSDYETGDPGHWYVQGDNIPLTHAQIQYLEGLGHIFAGNTLAYYDRLVAPKQELAPPATVMPVGPNPEVAVLEPVLPEPAAPDADKLEKE